jgi:hypothetical protein
VNATTTKTRKTLTPQPVHGVTRWVGSMATQGQLDNGDAVLKIVAEGKEAQFYFVAELKDENGHRVGYRLLKIDSLDQTATYDVDATGRDWTCDCPDAVYCDQPGGCKHSAGLRAALKTAGLPN